ncbi:hypothetical protein BDZ89DRAFT_977926 [Hymenopellis radicata]|nr:hypothetical protein BDZ89DRAFT_977926 [Hymenopellis radicata]
MMFSLLILAILLVSANVEAVYVRAEKTNRDVYNPKITSPTAKTVWVAGTTVSVTWDTSDAPQNITNDRGRVVLGQINSYNHSEHLDFDHPLAADFDIMDGNVSFAAPDVPENNNYCIVLFGDSGNASPTFSIIEP